MRLLVPVMWRATDDDRFHLATLLVNYRSLEPFSQKFLEVVLTLARAFDVLRVTVKTVKRLGPEASRLAVSW